MVVDFENSVIIELSLGFRNYSSLRFLKTLFNMWLWAPQLVFNSSHHRHYFYTGTKQFEEKLYAEIRGRIKEDDMSVPLRKGNYYYYERTLEGEEYVRHCRRAAPDSGVQLSVHDTMPTGPDAPPEHVILDENVKAKQHAYYCVDALKVSLHIVALTLVHC